MRRIICSLWLLIFALVIVPPPTATAAETAGTVSGNKAVGIVIRATGGNVGVRLDGPLSVTNKVSPPTSSTSTSISTLSSGNGNGNGGGSGNGNGNGVNNGLTISAPPEVRRQLSAEELALQQAQGGGLIPVQENGFFNGVGNGGAEVNNGNGNGNGNGVGNGNFNGNFNNNANGVPGSVPFRPAEWVNQWNRFWGLEPLVPGMVGVFPVVKELVTGGGGADDTPSAPRNVVPTERTPRELRRAALQQLRTTTATNGNGNGNGGGVLNGNFNGNGNG